MLSLPRFFAPGLLLLAACGGAVDDGPDPSSSKQGNASQQPEEVVGDAPPSTDTGHPSADLPGAVPGSTPAAEHGPFPALPACTYPAAAPGSTDPNLAAGVCPCSRREADNYPTCLQGSGLVTTATIGPEGGTVHVPLITYSGVALRLEFPPGAVAAATTITATAAGAPSSDFQDYSPLVWLEPLGLDLAAPVKVSLGAEGPYRDLNGYQPNMDLGLQFSAHGEECFAPAMESYLNAGFVQGYIDSFGVLFAGHLRPASLAACP